MTGDNVEATLHTDAVGAPFPVAPIDCDLHPAVPGIGALLPYFDELWRDMIVLRGIDKLALSLISYPANAPAAVAAEPAKLYQANACVRRWEGASSASAACSSARKGPISLPLGLMTPMMAAASSNQ